VADKMWFDYGMADIDRPSGVVQATPAAACRERQLLEQRFLLEKVKRNRQSLKSMKKQITIFSLVVATVTFWAGCQTAPTVVVTPKLVRCVVPTIIPVAETKEKQDGRQDKGGVEIAVVPVSYSAVRKDKTSLQRSQATGSTAIIGPSGNQVYVTETIDPELTAQPAKLQFAVRINNKLSRVFRCQGTVVQFNVAGKLIAFGDTDYKEFINGIVPPRNEMELKISGPLLSTIPEKGTIGLFLYDVVIEVDAAGNATKKANYEWYFNYTTQTVEEKAEVRTTSGYIDVLEYNRRIAQQLQAKRAAASLNRAQ